MVVDWIKQSYPHRHDLRMLDAGCGTGLMLQQLRDLGSADGVDISAEALDFCRKRGLTNVRQADILDLPFDALTYDAITALDVLEHVDEDTAALEEFARVLKPGGRVFAFVPAHKWLWSLQDEVSQHRRRYTSKTLRQAVTRSGLTIERLSYVSFFLLPVIYLGRQWLKVTLPFRPRETENDLHPEWANGILRGIFELEIPLLRRGNLPYGASLLCVARKAA